MKKILLLVASFFLICSFATAQTSLEFNQVLTYQLGHNTPQSFTVPSGKVWKIVSASVAWVNSSYYIQLETTGNRKIASLWEPETVNYPDPLPLWLPGGFSAQFRYTGGTSFDGLVSILEFNVVP